MLFRKLIFLIEVLFILLAISLPVYADDDSVGSVGSVGRVFCLGGIILFIVILVAMALRSMEAAERARQAEEEEEKRIRLGAEAAYKNSLAKLKDNPTNADLRQETLKLGRVYSNLACNAEGVTIFDEVALMNDINAVCGGVTNITNTPPLPSPTNTASLSLEERLVKLSELRAKGLIDEQEYNTKRKQILDEI
jgi:hypothetical protein